MDGRWTIRVCPTCKQHGNSCFHVELDGVEPVATPVVPCDDAAIDRVAAALFPHIPSPYTDDEAERFARSLALMALGAARATPS